jgi:hypothetical protein
MHQLYPTQSPQLLLVSPLLLYPLHLSAVRLILFHPETKLYYEASCEHHGHSNPRPLTPFHHRPAIDSKEEEARIGKDGDEDGDGG